MTCRTLQGRYAEALEKRIKKTSKYIKKCLKSKDKLDFDAVLITILSLLDRREDYEFLEQKNKKQ